MGTSVSPWYKDAKVRSECMALLNKVERCRLTL
jgi:hypothetical protein